MDSVTQLALGSAVGYAALASKLGRSSLLIGAVFGTVPDLDVLIDFGGPVENFVFHRSFSHSILMQIIFAPIAAWVITRFSWAQKVSLRRWAFAIFLMMSTHALLDSLTVYGTQLLWPLTDYPFGVSSLFIIDPLYTLPLVVSLLVLSFLSKPFKRTRFINTSALVLSTLYIGWSVTAKWLVDARIEEELITRGIKVGAYESTPSAFNTLLWRAVAVTPDGYFEIYTSVFDSNDEMSLYFYDSQPSLLSSIDDEWRIQKLQSFTKGLYGVSVDDGVVQLSDLRMGLEGAYVFTFNVGKINDDHVIPFTFEQDPSRPPLSQAVLLWERIWDPRIDLSLSGRQQAISNK